MKTSVPWGGRDSGSSPPPPCSRQRRENSAHSRCGTWGHCAWAFGTWKAEAKGRGSGRAGGTAERGGTVAGGGRGVHTLARAGLTWASVIATSAILVAPSVLGAAPAAHRAAEAGERQMTRRCNVESPIAACGRRRSARTCCPRIWLCRERPTAGNRPLREMRLWCGPVCAGGCYALFSRLTMCAETLGGGDRSKMAGGKWAPIFVQSGAPIAWTAQSICVATPAFWPHQRGRRGSRVARGLCRLPEWRTSTSQTGTRR